MVSVTLGELIKTIGYELSDKDLYVEICEREPIGNCVARRKLVKVDRLKVSHMNATEAFHIVLEQEDIDNAPWRKE